MPLQFPRNRIQKICASSQYPQIQSAHGEGHPGHCPSRTLSFLVLAAISAACGIRLQPHHEFKPVCCHSVFWSVLLESTGWIQRHSYDQSSRDARYCYKTVGEYRPALYRMLENRYKCFGLWAVWICRHTSYSWNFFTPKIKAHQNTQG